MPRPSVVVQPASIRFADSLSSHPYCWFPIHLSLASLDWRQKDEESREEFLISGHIVVYYVHYFALMYRQFSIVIEYSAPTICTNA